MTTNHQIKQDESKGSVIPAVIAVTGAVIGAGVAVVAGAVALRDENNREKVKEAIETAKDKTGTYLESVQKEANIAKADIDTKINEGKDKIKKLVS